MAQSAARFCGRIVCHRRRIDHRSRAFVALAGLLSGHIAMSAHGFGLIVLLQAAWVVAVGVSMIRAQNDSVPVTPIAIQP